MIAFRFTFDKDPRDEERGPIQISVIADSQEEAWQEVSKHFGGISAEDLQTAMPTVEMKELRKGEIVVAGPDGLARAGDPWPHVFSTGIREVTSAITQTYGSVRKDKAELERKKLGIDLFIIAGFLSAFLGSLAFGCYAIATGSGDDVFSFVFPIMTALLGLIGGYLGGRGAAGRANNV
jgi:hypothetical protein